MSGTHPTRRRVVGPLTAFATLAAVGDSARGTAAQTSDFRRGWMEWGESERRHLAGTSVSPTRRPVGSDKKRKCTKAQRKRKRQQQKASRKRNR